MKKFLLLTFVSLLCAGAFAQETVVRHNDKGLFVAHTVTPKENFYSLGRLYNIPPKDIAAYNNLEMEKGLSVGQVVNIPLSAANFTQDKTTGHPLYYVVGEKEGLYRVSVNNNKVLMANLRQWNGLQTDAISAGQKLIVGYLVTNDAQAVAAKPKEPETKTAETKVTVKAPEEKKETPPATEVVKKEEKPVVQTPPVEKKPEPVKAAPVASVNDASGGYFKPDFEAQTKAQPARKDDMVTAGIFKTASGWQDAKYYALIDGIEPGSIIRVVNPSNNHAIYAKVLDKMTGIRQNQGYNLRISNAAATALGVTDTEKFVVRVNY